VQFHATQSLRAPHDIQQLPIKQRNRQIIVADCLFVNANLALANKNLHPGGLTWNLQITNLERKMIFQTSMIMFHVILQGCNAINNCLSFLPSIQVLGWKAGHFFSVHKSLVKFQTPRLIQALHGWMPCRNWEHLIQLIRYLSGARTAVTAVMGEKVWEGDPEHSNWTSTFFCTGNMYVLLIFMRLSAFPVVVNYQDVYIFGRWSRTKTSFATLGRGTAQVI